ncbi:tumor necrosis factor receptor superfamily member 1A isoform X2 [Centrocercus urophasianus]|uniref:tumor necrosis factor receptor superfamily member 1A isoform X2 n=1 Tax=Centrocercus urophasianus TaxID=9002 RepID=UPI001C650A47|nr:tumor necrosis factor receptor superfamily member 1A isoform X2 [Centrocercus urophasianus]
MVGAAKHSTPSPDCRALASQSLVGICRGGLHTGFKAANLKKHISDLMIVVILTFVCVLMDESEGIAPVPYMLQLRRVTLDGRYPFNILRREKRQVRCQLGQYLHPKGTHCCMRCHAGTYKSKDCKWPDQAPVCLPCPNGTFTAVDNIMKKCFQCTRCRAELQQIEETPCTLKQDTVCGCRKNQYQFGQADFFQCKNCSPCVNGVIANCSKDRDAICRCKPMFFLTLNNVCKHCNSCIGEECLQCNSPVTTSPNSSELNGNLVLGIIVGIIVVICVLYIVNKAVKLVQKNGIASSFYSCGEYSSICCDTVIGITQMCECMHAHVCEENSGIHYFALIQGQKEHENSTAKLAGMLPAALLLRCDWKCM